VDLNITANNFVQCLDSHANTKYCVL